MGNERIDIDIKSEVQAHHIENFNLYFFKYLLYSLA